MATVNGGRLADLEGSTSVSLRIAALIDTVQVSGPGRQLAALASCLSQRGVVVHVITFHRRGRPRSPYLDYLESAGVPYSVLEEDGPFDVRLVMRLRRLLARLEPTIVQTHGYKPTALAYALRRAGAPWRWIAFFHGATSENLKVKLYHWLDGRLFRTADRVIVMSRLHAQRFAFLGSRVGVLYNAALPLAGLTDPTARERRGGLPPRLGVVGRLSPEKGVDVFLQACRTLVDRGVKFTAVIAGDGPARVALEQLRDALGLAAHVGFLGTTVNIERVYASIDLLVIPSRSEGLPNVMLEALRADVPVVATRVGAIPEVLESTLAGVIVPPGSSAALADGIVAAVPMATDDHARAARRGVTERFSIDRRAAEHLALYGELVAPVCREREAVVA